MPGTGRFSPGRVGHLLESSDALGRPCRGPRSARGPVDCVAWPSANARSGSPTSPTCTAEARTSRPPCWSARSPRSTSLAARHRRLLRRPHDVRLQARVPACAPVPRSICDAFVVVPGNHDARNVGYVHFEDLFGERSSVLRKDGVTVVAVDSTEPDLDHGQIGRGRYSWIEAVRRRAVRSPRLRAAPSPAARARNGAERNVVYDAGDAIECLLRAGVHLVLSGHKHVPYAWRREPLRRQHGDGFFASIAGTDKALLQRRGGQRPPRRFRAGTRSTGRSASSSSPSRRSSTRSTPAASSGR